MARIVIPINGGSPISRKLTIGNGRRNTNAWRGDTIMWIVHQHANVNSIRIEGKQGTDDIFETDPAPVNGNRRIWTAVISDEAPRGAKYYYTIHWVHPDTPDEEFPDDPLIAIRSSITDKRLALIPWIFISLGL